MTISQEDARRAIELLTRCCDRAAELPSPGPDPYHVDLDDDVVCLLYDADSGTFRFEERDIDPSPDCRCETCPPNGPFTCVSTD